VSLKIIGAGLGRTGTASLKVAVERLLGAPCYHMAEVFQHPEHIPMWTAAAHGKMPDWETLFTGYAAEVDWPASAYWKELSEAYPNAPILLSTRDPNSWWESASSTIFPSIQFMRRRSQEWYDMIQAMMAARFVPDLTDREACIAAYEKHNALVRASVPAARLIEWRPGDGWQPLCSGLNLPVPDEPYPHVNTREDFTRMVAEQSASEVNDNH
jgi:hypothetical protein